MKKTSKLACMVASGIVLACTMLFSACQKEYSVSKGPEAPELEGIDSVHIAHQFYLEDESEYANGEIRFVCLDSVWAFKGGASYSGTAKCKCVWSVDRRVLRDLPEDTCMAISATADPTRLIFGANNTVVALQSAEMLYANVVVDGIEYSVKNRLFGHKCLTTPYRLCTSGDNVTFWGRGDDNDTVSAEGDRGRNVHDTIPVHHYDTVVVERHDTTFIVVRDTTFIVDTVTNDTIRFIVDSVVYSPAHISEANLVFVSGTLRAECANTIATTVYRNGQVHSTTSRNFAGIFDHLYSETGNYLTSHVGMARAIGANGVVNWGNGYSETFVHQPHYTTPSGYEAWLRYLDCDFVLDSVYGQSNGILVAGHYVCPNGNHRKTYLIPKTPGNPDTPPTITRVDTLWLNCTTASASYIALTDQVQVAKNRTYRKINVWSDGHRDTSSTVYTATFNHLYNVVRVGQPTTSMATSVLVNVNSNTASFGGGAFTETLSSANGDRFCSDDWVSARLTTSGTEWNGNYGTSTYTVLVPETFAVAPPITGKRLIAGWVSYAYPSNTSAPEEWGVLYTEDLATGQRYFEYIPWHTGTVTYSEVTNIVAISSSDTVAMRTQINAGRYGARMYDHRDGHFGQWLPGFTHAVTNGTSGSGSTSTTSWTDTYWGLTGVEMNHVDLVVATTDSNSGNSRRGVWNGTVLSADNGDLYVSNL